MRIPDDVREVLERSSTDGDLLTLPGQLDRDTYVKVDKALKAAGFKWKRGRGGHQADDGDAADALAALLGGEVQDQQDTQYFPTPARVVEQMLDLAELGPDMLALEPSAGQGAIAGPLAARVAAVDCVELYPRNVAKLQATGFARAVHEADFLDIYGAPLGEYDRIVMNPPFTRGADAKHVLHALRFLAPGGILVSVMSAGVDYRKDRPTTRLHAIVEERGGRWIELPEGTFKNAGTSVRTCLVVIPGEPVDAEPAAEAPAVDADPDTPADSGEAAQRPPEPARPRVTADRVASFTADVDRLAAEAGIQLAMF